MSLGILQKSIPFLVVGCGVKVAKAERRYSIDEEFDGKFDKNKRIKFQASENENFFYSVLILTFKR